MEKKLYLEAGLLPVERTRMWSENLHLTKRPVSNEVTHQAGAQLWVLKHEATKRISEGFTGFYGFRRLHPCLNSPIYTTG